MNRKSSSNYPVRKGMSSGQVLLIAAIASALLYATFAVYRNVIHPSVRQSVSSVLSRSFDSPSDSGSSWRTGPVGSIDDGKVDRHSSSLALKPPKPPRKSLFASAPSTGAQGYVPSEYQLRKALLDKYSRKDVNRIRSVENVAIEEALQELSPSIALVGAVVPPPKDSILPPTYPVPCYGVLVRTPKEGFYFVLSANHAVPGGTSPRTAYVRFADGTVVKPLAIAQKPNEDIVVFSIAAEDVPESAVPAKLSDNAFVRTAKIAAFAPPEKDGEDDPTSYKRSSRFMEGKLAKEGGTGDFMFEEPIIGGCSGGPVVDQYGAVIGLIESRRADDGRDARGIPIVNAIRFADKHIERLTSPDLVQTNRVALTRASYPVR